MKIDSYDENVVAVDKAIATGAHESTVAELRYPNETGRWKLFVRCNRCTRCFSVARRTIAGVVIALKCSPFIRLPCASTR